jgi:hypothetical protein
VPCISSLLIFAGCTAAVRSAPSSTCGMAVDTESDSFSTRTRFVAAGCQQDWLGSPRGCVVEFTCCWEGPLGAVRLLDRPSWLT